MMRHPITTFLYAALVAGLVSAGQAAIVTDTFTRTIDNPPGGWGAVDNGAVGGATGTVGASYSLDAAGSVDGATGRFSNNRIALDYDLAADPAVIAGGGFVVDVQVNPTDGDDSGTGREFAGIALSHTIQNPPYGGAGAITNTSNDTLRFSLFPRNSGSVGNLQRQAGNARVLTAVGDPSNAGFDEFIFDQPTFDDYVNQGTPDPFVNDQFYDVRLVVRSTFAPAAPATIAAYVDGKQVDFDLSDADIDNAVVEWGSVGEAYVSFIAFNGSHQYDNLRITALPEPTTAALALLAATGLVSGRRRR